MSDNWELTQKVEEIHALLARCDAYEARIEELEAMSRTKLVFEIIMKMEADIQELQSELARVKAESLRAVPVGDPEPLVSMKG